MHLLAAVSGHGFGHLAQVIPVLEALHARDPALELTLRTSLPREVVAARLRVPFRYQRAELDLGMAMASAMEVAAEASWRAHRAFHREWPARLAAEVERLRLLRPDAILADVPYLTLAAAREAGIPAVALCSLHWADIFDHYCGAMAGAAEMVATMREAYASAERFLQPQPAMPMADLPNRRPIAPIARLGTGRRAEVDAALGLAPGERLVTVALGGIPTRLAVEHWPRVGGVHLVVPPEWGVAEAHIHPWDRLDLPFIDLLRTSDALIAKPGYGTFAEAACNGVPLLYLPRDGWPETPPLVAWLERRGRGLPVTLAHLEAGGLGEVLRRLWAEPHPAPPEPRGAEEAAEVLWSLRGRRS